MSGVGDDFSLYRKDGHGHDIIDPLILLHLIATLNSIFIGKEITHGGMNIALLAFSGVIAHRRYPGHPLPTRIEGFYHWTHPVAM
jgi:hypothetical protein